MSGGKYNEPFFYMNKASEKHAVAAKQAQLSWIEGVGSMPGYAIASLRWQQSARTPLYSRVRCTLTNPDFPHYKLPYNHILV